MARALLVILAVCFVAILLVLPVHAFISTWGGTAIGPLLVWKSWKEIVLLALVPLVAWLCILRPDIARALWRSWMNRLVLAYVLLTIIMAFASQASFSAIIAGLLMNLRFFAIFVLAQVIVASGAPWVLRLKKWLVPWLLITAAALSVGAILQVTVIPKNFLAQFGYSKATITPYVVVDQDPTALRAFATMRGPNTLAAYLLLPIALALILWWQDRKRWWAIGTAGLSVVALALTGSRSAWLGAAAMVALLAFVTLPRQKLIKWLKWGTIPLVAIVVLVLWLATTVPQVRLAIFHSGYGSMGSLTQGSSDQHWKAAWSGIEEVFDDPLGQGVGSAGPASFYNTSAAPVIPEDYFVQIALETGLLGIALFIFISLATGQKLLRVSKDAMPRALLVSFIGINIINLFLHGWADDPTAMTWWGIAGLYILQPPSKKKP